MPSKYNTLSSKISQDEIDFLKENYGKTMFGSEICKKFGWSSSKLERATRVLGLKSSLQKYNNNANLEEIKMMSNPKIIYALGYIWADGYIQKVKRKGSDGYLYQATKISIVSDDFNEVSDCFHSLGKASIYLEQRRHYRPITTFILCDTKLANYLADFNYQDKSLSSPEKILQAIPENLRRYWWRGYLDGDGCITASKNGCPQLSFSGNFECDWSFLSQISSKIDVKRRINKKNHKYSSVSYGGEEAKNILAYIYQNYENDKIGLPRKYKKFQLCKNYIKGRRNNAKYVYFSKGHNKWVVYCERLNIQKLFKTEEAAVEFRNSIFPELSDTLNTNLDQLTKINNHNCNEPL